MFMQMPIIVNAPMLGMRRPISTFRALHSKDRLPRKIAELRSGITRLRWIREDGTLTNPGSNDVESVEITAVGNWQSFIPYHPDLKIRFQVSGVRFQERAT
jgi:hypothetical protein